MGNRMEYKHYLFDGVELSVRTINGLKEAGISTLKEASLRSPKQLLSIRNFGRVSLVELRAVLKTKGLYMCNDDLLTEVQGISLLLSQAQYRLRMLTQNFTSKNGIKGEEVIKNEHE